MQTEIMQKIAQRVSVYFRACWWADADDLRQEALAALLQADQRGQLENRSEGTVFYIALRHASRFLREMSGPVRVGWRHRKHLAQYQRTPIEELAEEGATERSVWRVAVWEKIEEHALPEVAERVLLWQETPKEVAEALQISVEAVYLKVRLAKRRLAADRKLEALWKDKP